MKHITLLSFTVLLVYNFNIHAQQLEEQIKESDNIKLVKGSASTNTLRLELSSDIDANWEKWQHRGYSFGFDPAITPMYTTINGIVSTPYMIQVRGDKYEKNKKRWGYHVFEGYATDDKSRITLLLNKHDELSKAVAELYYYGTEYNHSDRAYNWFRIGSDVRKHSFLFSRDKAVFYGSLQLTNAFTLGNIGSEDIESVKPDGDDERNFDESARHVNFVALKESGDGTMFYDKDNDLVVIKVNGEWMRVIVKPLPKGVAYDFE